MQENVQLPLHEWACLRTELVWIYDHAVRPESRRQTSDRPTGNWAWYLRKGRATVSTASRTYEIKPGMWLFLPDGKACHSFSGDAHLLSIRFLYQWPSGENVVKNSDGLLFKGKEFPQLEARAVRLHRLIRRHLAGAANYRLQIQHPTDGRIFLRFQAAFMEWVETWLDINIRAGSGLARLRSGDDRPLRAARCLNAAVLDQGYPRSQLLSETGLSEVHLNRIFLNEFNLSPRKYWDRRRLEFAKTCLETSLMPVKEISYQLGFRSDAHFAVWFRRLTRRRPGEFRAGQAEAHPEDGVEKQW